MILNRGTKEMTLFKDNIDNNVLRSITPDKAVQLRKTATEYIDANIGSNDPQKAMIARLLATDGLNLMQAGVVAEMMRPGVDGECLCTALLTITAMQLTPLLACSKPGRVYAQLEDVLYYLRVALSLVAETAVRSDKAMLDKLMEELRGVRKPAAKKASD